MTQEKLDLLVHDLCARLAHGVIVETPIDDDIYKLIAININKGIAVVGVDIDNVILYTESKLRYIKPYLFPISNMTEKQKEEFCLLQDKIIYNGRRVVYEDIMEYLNWLYKNHFDINNLIQNGLANDATGLGIY